MPVVNFIPHKLSRLIVRDGYEDENGDWHEGSKEWGDEMDCHAVPAGAANTIAYPDGSIVTYSYVIGRLAPDCPEFKVGDKIRLRIGDMIRESTVKGFNRWQWQSKIWV